MFRAPLLLLMAVAGLAFAQTPSSGGWRRVGDRPPAAQPPSAQPPAPVAQPPANTAQAGGPAAPGQDPEPVDRSDAYGQPSQPSANVPNYDAPSADRSMDQQAPPAANRPGYGLPPEVTVRPGTYLTVRLAQALSSDRNQPGDTFVA